MSIPSPFVWYQESSHNGTNVTFNSSPAIVTSRQMKRMPLRRATDEWYVDSAGRKQVHKAGDWQLDKAGAQVLSEPIEVVSLTVFLDGSFEFLKDICPYTDDLGRLPGSISYRAIDADVPKVDLQPPKSVDETLFGPRTPSPAPTPALGGTP